jgi:membrane protease YdiL (CAAX protease family)
VTAPSVSTAAIPLAEHPAYSRGAIAAPHSGRRAAWLLVGLTVATLVRAAANGHTTTSALAAGSAFGVALIGVALVAGWRPARPTRPALRSLAIGAVGAVVLIGLPLLLHPAAMSAIGMRPGPLVAWAGATILVATAEEVLLRGALFDAFGRLYGLWAAVLASSLAFALMHVPLYGWAVVPLDIAAGVWLCALRLSSGGVAAPAVAHALADLATWWL